MWAGEGQTQSSAHQLRTVLQAHAMVQGKVGQQTGGGVPCCTRGRPERQTRSGPGSEHLTTSGCGGKHTITGAACREEDGQGQEGEGQGREGEGQGQEGEGQGREGGETATTSSCVQEAPKYAHTYLHDGKFAPPQLGRFTALHVVVACVRRGERLPTLACDTAKGHPKKESKRKANSHITINQRMQAQAQTCAALGHPVITHPTCSVLTQ